MEDFSAFLTEKDNENGCIILYDWKYNSKIFQLSSS